MLNKLRIHEDRWGRRGIAPAFLTSALVGDEWAASRPCHFTSDEKPQVSFGYEVGPFLTLWKIEKNLPLAVIEPKRSSPQQLAIPTELF